MTREEAITNLNMISVAFVEPVTKEQRKLIDDTFDMAIKALEQEPWVKCLTCRDYDVENQHCMFIPDYCHGYDKYKPAQAKFVEPCEDAISRDAVIKDFTQWRGKMAYSIGEDYSGVSLLDKAIRVIKGMPPVTPKPNFCASCKHNTDNEICLECEYDGITRGMTRYESVTQKWIPVSERLPEEHGIYLVTTENGKVDVCCTNFYHEGNYDFWVSNEQVIAWMPLPEPYEPQERSDKK